MAITLNRNKFKYKNPSGSGYRNVDLLEEGSKVNDVQVDGTSVVTAGVANIDLSGKADKADTVLDTTLSRGRKADTTVGTASIAFGDDVTASGNYSQAFGRGSVASGLYSFAEGYNVTASSSSSHAEGQSTKATGLNSHAEGFNTIASASSAHAEGGSTVASNGAAHAEGAGTVASGDRGSHAEGEYSKATGIGSHAEGSYTEANGYGSHAEGLNTVANARGSHVEGMSNVPDSYYDYEEWVPGKQYEVGDKVTRTYAPDNIQGFVCTVANNASTWEFQYWKNTMGTMHYAHIVGNGEYNSPSNAYALDWEGNGHFAGDVYVGANSDSTGGEKLVKESNVPVEVGTEAGSVKTKDFEYNNVGYSNVASGAGSFAEGMLTISSGSGSHSEGSMTTASGDQSHAEGLRTIASASAAHSEGRQTQADSRYQHVQGMFNVSDSNNVYADIVGNGSSNSARSNAYALTWEGDGKYAGDVYVGANADSSGGSKLARESIIAPVESATATAAHAIGDKFILDGQLCKATAAIAVGDAIATTGISANAEVTQIVDELGSGGGGVSDVQIGGNSILNSGVANIPWASSNGTKGVVTADPSYGIDVSDSAELTTVAASDQDIQEGADEYKPIVPITQHESVFYGLAKAAGDSTQAQADTQDYPVGSYTNSAKTAIKTMLGVTDPISTLAGLTDVQLQSPIYAGQMLSFVNNKWRNVSVNSTQIFNEWVDENNDVGYGAGKVYLCSGPQGEWPIVAGDLRNYAVSKLCCLYGDTDNDITPITSYHEDYIDGGYYWTAVFGNRVYRSNPNEDEYMSLYAVISPDGLNVVEVTSTTPTITAEDNTRYICTNELSTLDISATDGLSFQVEFYSGSTPTVLTANSLTWQEWFDPDNLEADCRYEINVVDCFATVAVWHNVSSV